MDVNALISDLEKASYKTDSGSTWYLISGSKEHALLRAVVYEWAGKQDEAPNKARIAELEAKVYAYEQIIANSNFAPMLIPHGYIQPLNEVPTEQNSTN